jgi:hypothetical protein
MGGLDPAIHKTLKYFYDSMDCRAPLQGLAMTASWHHRMDGLPKSAHNAVERLWLC